MFSVVIPLYNKELSIRHTIQSVLDQSCQDFEIVIVNDGSTDGSVEVVQGFDDWRIRLFHQENQGVSVARNRAIEEVKYEWVVLLDGDDLWKKNHLSVLRSMLMQYPEDRVFCTSYIKSNQSAPGLDQTGVEVIDNYFKVAIKEDFFWTSVACIHQSVFREVGFFDKRMSRGEDLDLWGRIGRKYRFIRSKAVTAIYRTEAENRSVKAFDLHKSRVYNYDFNSSTSLEETRYYKAQVVNSLRRALANKKLKNFFKLKRKHAKYVSWLDVLKK